LSGLWISLATLCTPGTPRASLIARSCEDSVSALPDSTTMPLFTDATLMLLSFSAASCSSTVSTRFWI
jgi:hypothetical protein